MNDLLFLLRWIREDQLRSIHVSRWDASADGVTATWSTGSSSAYSSGRTTLQALRNLSRTIQKAES